MLRFAFIAALLAAPALARAEDKPPVVLRFIGEAPAIGEAGPARFVLDAAATPSEEGGYEVKGWLGSFAPVNDHGEVTGRCVGRACELKVDLDGHDLLLNGELLGAAGPVDGRFEIKGDVSESAATKGPARFTPTGEAIAGLGTLARADAVDSRTLDELLLWQDIDPVFGDDETHPPDDSQHDHIASWQQSASRPINGLVLVEELALLKAQAAEAQKAAGWTRLGAPEGWSVSYPAALLPKAAQAGAERRFESADGKATLTLAFDSPMSGDAFDAFVDKTHAEAAAAADPDSFNFVRTGDDMRYSYAKGERMVEAVFYARKRGLARLVYTHPKAGPLADIATPITGSLRAARDED